MPKASGKCARKRGDLKESAVGQGSSGQQTSVPAIPRGTARIEPRPRPSRLSPMRAYRATTDDRCLQRRVEGNNWLQARGGVIVASAAMGHPLAASFDT